MSDLLTIPQTAARLQCSICSVRRLIETGALPSIRLGKLVRVDPGDLAVLIHTCKAKAAQS
jgi:excisionase family DNA binding protein